MWENPRNKNAYAMVRFFNGNPAYPNPTIPYILSKPVNWVAREIGWGWHRTNNTMKELSL